MKKQLITLAGALLLAASPAFAAAARSTYPVVFAHGMGGFDNILGYDYWGDDYGVFVGDPCNEFLELTCNGDIDSGQKAFAASVTPFQSSEVRGLELADDIEGYIASVGSTKVNIIGHSQGGIDARKAAKILYQRKGTQVVRVLMSVSSPHRGSPVAKHVLSLGSGVTSVVNALATLFGNTIYNGGSDGYASLKTLVYGDWPGDTQTTGAKVFNTSYPVSTTYAYRYVSIVTAQNGLSVNPALFLVKGAFIDIDGDGYCVDDCDNDGAGGKGDGTKTDLDDDGLVGINSQQMGYRLKYTESLLALDSIATDSTMGNVTSINAPTSAQMTSAASIVNQDHADVIGVPPDTFDEMEFYAAAINYIASFD